MRTKRVAAEQVADSAEDIEPSQNIAAKRGFVCEYAGCGKRFQRKEHLNRHTLNHNPRTTYNCEKCTKVFYRKDLYKRHLDRHNRGMWFRRTGIIPGQNDKQQQPNDEDSNNNISITDSRSNSTEPSPQGNNTSTPAITPDTASNSPSGFHNTHSVYNSHQPHTGAALLNHPPPFNGHTTHILPPPPPASSSLPHSLPPQTHPQYSAGPPPVSHNDLNTSSSPYNSIMPPANNFPTQQHYIQQNFQQQQQQQPPSLPLPSNNINNGNPSGNSTPPTMPPLYSGNFFQDSDLGWLFENMNQTFEDNPINNNYEQQHDDQTKTIPITPEYTATTPEVPDEDTIWHTVSQKLMKSLFDQKSDSASNSPLDACTLPNSFSNELVNSWVSDPILLRRYYQSYFDTYHDHFPIVHKPTFLRRPDKIHPLLMISILTLGTAFAPVEHFQISLKIHERLRWLVFSHNDLADDPPLWIFQALILIEAFEKMLSSRKHHELAATFHGSIVILMRRNQPFSFDIDDEDWSSADENYRSRGNNSRKQSSSYSKYSIESKWNRWIENESLRRVFFLAFTIDSQHVALFGHSQCMSANEILFELPCLEDVWDAPDAETWLSLYESSTRPPLFLDAIKSLLMLKPLDKTTSQFSRLIILHGLYSVAVQTQTQKNAAIGFLSGKNEQCRHCGKPHQHSSSGGSSSNGGGGEQWRALLAQALQTWSFSLFTQGSIIIEACQSLHQMAYVTLYLSHTTVLDILVFARYPSLVSRRLTRRDYAKAEHLVKTWSSTPEAIVAVRHALLLIQETLFPKRSKQHSPQGYREEVIYEANTDKVALRPWCLFVCTLVVYAFHNCIHKTQAKLPPSLNNNSSNSDALIMTDRYISNRLHALSTPYPVDFYVNMDKTESENIMCVLKGVQSTLVGCRWDMLEHAYNCLGSLIFT